MTRIERKYGRFARNIRELRQQEDLSQTQVARDLGLSPATIHNLEDGTTKSPGIFLLCAIADYFGIPIDDLLRKDLADTGALESTVSFMREGMTESELIGVVGSVSAIRNEKRKSGYFRVGPFGTSSSDS